VNECSGFVENGSAEVGQSVQLGDAVGHIAQKHSNVIVGISPRIAARTGAV
jgi:hypothetical protein